MILQDFEPKDIDFTYKTSGGHGRMHIVIVPFFEEQVLVKIKKLLNIIRTSDNPEKEQVIADYCKQWLGEYEVEQKVNANGHVDAKERARKIEVEIEYHKRIRERYKRNTEPYKQCTELLKKMRGQLSDENAIAKKYLTDFHRNQKIKVKYEKILEFISQG